MLTIKQVLRIAIILAVVSSILGYIYYKCPITFKTNLEVGNIVTLLLNFGVIAILVQRFATQFLLNDEYYQFMSASNMKGYGPFISTGKMKTEVVKIAATDGTEASTTKTQEVAMSPNEEIEDSKKKFKQQLFWISWGIGMVIAAIGFRFFNNVIEMPTSCKAWKHTEITVILDIFMTGILLSGGSALIQQIIMWWKSEEK